MSVVSTGELAVLARACVEDPYRDVPLVLQRGVGYRIYGQHYSLRCLPPRMRAEEYDKLGQYWGGVAWRVCTVCGRRIWRERSLKVGMGHVCEARTKAEAHRLEIQLLKEAE